jgi:hypothetical protein
MADPAIVLVHRAFADASGFRGLYDELLAEDVTIIAPPNPMRGLRGGDGEYLKGVIDESPPQPNSGESLLSANQSVADAAAVTSWARTDGASGARIAHLTRRVADEAVVVRDDFPNPV